MRVARPPRRMAAEVKTEAGAPSDELAALRDSELRMQQRLTEQRRRESKVVLRAAVCESEKRKLSETVAGLQRAVQPAQKQVLPPAPCPCPHPWAVVGILSVRAVGGSPVGGWSLTGRVPDREATTPSGWGNG